MLIAHKSLQEEVVYREQSLKEHLENVSKLCGIYADKIGLKFCGEIIGYAHDIGKASTCFQNYIKGEKQMEKGPDHSTAGAIFIFEIAKKYTNNKEERLASEIISLVIMSHHGGLANIYNEFGDTPFLNRIEKISDKKYKESYLEAIENMPQFFDVEKAENLFKLAVCEIENIVKKINETFTDKNYYFGLVCKYLYSVLIDADRYDSACFSDNTAPIFVESLEDFSSISKTYEAEILKLKPNSNINIQRKILSDNCFNSSFRGTGIYTLNCPTGSGKTLSSFRFALNHARVNKKSRIFYVAPFLTILKQNVRAISEKIINSKDVILEVHSAKESNQVVDETTLKTNELFSQRLNYPIVFISMVRFLNIFFSTGSKNSRPIHNFANSIIIFDEVQTISPKHIAIFNGVINFLRDICNATIILSTATQPMLNSEIDKDIFPVKLSVNHEISGCSQEIINEFRRTKIIDKTKLKSQEDIANFIVELSKENNSVLVILNTKNAVKKIYELLKIKNIAQLFVLTTNLYPVHREKTLNEIRFKLKKEKVIVISTQLIEAGVDISFSCVVRSLAGLDSIIQSSGRCNRHGEFNETLGQVYIVKPDFENLDNLTEIKVGKGVVENILLLKKRNSQSTKSLDDIEYIDTYFKKYYLQQKDELKYPLLKDKKYNIYDLLSDNLKLKNEALSNKGLTCNLSGLTQSFKFAENNFEAIEKFGKSVIVMHNDSINLVEQLKNSRNFKDKKAILKQLERYTVNLFTTDKNNGIEYFEECGIYISKEGYYDEIFGVSTDIVQKNYNF